MVNLCFILKRMLLLFCSCKNTKSDRNKCHVPLGFELRENQVWSCWDQQCCAKHLLNRKKNSIQESNPFSLTKKLVKKLIVQVGQRMERNIQWIEHYQVANSINCYGTVIYAVDIAIKPLNNWGLVSNQLYFLANKLKQVRSSGSILLPWREALSIRLTIKLAHTGKIAETWVTSTNERARSPYFTLHASLQGHHIPRHVCNTNTSWAKFYLSRQSFVLYFHVYSDTNIPLMATRFFPRKQISSA